MRVLAAMCALCVAGAASIGAARAGETWDAARARGTLRVGTTGDYKPFSFRQPDGSYVGTDITQVEQLGAALGLKVEYVPTAWGRLMQDFTDRKFDMAVGGVSILPARQAAGAFTPVLQTDGKRPVVRCADRDRFTSVAAIDRPEVRVVVNPGASNEQFARANFTHAHLDVHADNPTVPDEIAAGRADVFVTDGIEVDHIAAVHPGVLCAAALPKPFTEQGKGWWMQNDPALAAAVDPWVTQHLADYTRQLAADVAKP